MTITSRNKSIYALAAFLIVIMDPFFTYPMIYMVASGIVFFLFCLAIITYGEEESW